MHLAPSDACLLVASHGLARASSTTHSWCGPLTRLSASQVSIGGHRWTTWKHSASSHTLRKGVSTGTPTSTHTGGKRRTSACVAPKTLLVQSRAAQPGCSRFYTWLPLATSRARPRSAVAQQRVDDHEDDRSGKQAATDSPGYQACQAASCGALHRSSPTLPTVLRSARGLYPWNVPPRGESPLGGMRGSSEARGASVVNPSR